MNDLIKTHKRYLTEINDKKYSISAEISQFDSNYIEIGLKQKYFDRVSLIIDSPEVIKEMCAVILKMVDIAEKDLIKKD